MRIALYSLQYPGSKLYGGAGVYAEQIATALARQDHEVHVLTAGVDSARQLEGGALSVHPVPAIDLPFARSLSFRRSVPGELKRLTAQVGAFDVVHSNELFVARLHATPTVLTIHHVLAVLHRIQSRPKVRGDGNPWILRNERQAIRRTDRVIAVSTASKLELERAYPQATAPVTAVLNGVDTAPFEAEVTDSRTLRERQGLIPGQALIVSSPGSLTDERKAMPDLLAALAALPESIHWKAVILGRGDPASLAPWLSVPRVAERVELPGFVSSQRKIDLLRAADIFAMPSLLEGCPTAMVEAMAAGCAVVASDAGGIPDLIQSAEQGILVPSRDVPALAAALTRLLKDPLLCRAMGAVNRGIALERLTWSRAASETAEVYRSARSEDSACCPSGTRRRGP